jgi:hypothetical protein
MFRHTAAGLVLTCVLCGCRGPVAQGTVPLPDGSTLRVAGSEREGARWQLLQRGRWRELPPPPVSLFPVQVASSPDGRFLAVLSVGEGHPVLDLLLLSRVLEGTHGERSLRTLDPYPGSIELLGWVGHRLRVASDRPLVRCCDASGRIPGDEVADVSAPYLLDPDSGILQPE